MMNIIVCIKQVPDTSEVRIDPVKNNLVRDGVPSIMNPADRTALEMALKIKRENGANVTVVSMGPPQAGKELETALKMGADRAILLCGRKFGGADTLATAYTLASAIARLKYDLIMCGVEAIDGCTGQVGAMIGECLGIPAFTYVDSIRIERERMEVVRDTGNRIETYSAKALAVVCMLRKPAQVAETEETEQKLEIWDESFADESRIGRNGSPTRVVRIATAESRSDYLFVPHDWSLEQRMEYIFNGGIDQKGIKPIRGSVEKLAGILIDELY